MAGQQVAMGRRHNRRTGSQTTGERRSWRRSSGSAMATGAERVNHATLKRFRYRFSRFNLSETAIRQSCELTDATLYVCRLVR